MSDLKLDVHALVDGEMIDGDRAQIMAAMEQDSQLQAEYEWAVYIKYTLNEKCKGQGSEECWQAAMAQLNAIDKTKRTENFVGRYAWAFCGVFVLAIGIASVSNQMTGRTSINTASTASFFSGGSAVQNKVTPDEAMEAIKARLGSSPARLTAMPMLRVDQVLYGQVQGHKAVLLRFIDRQGSLELTCIQGVTAVDSIGQDMGNGLTSGQVNGVNAVAWSDGETLMVLAADRPHAELAAVVLGGPAAH